MKTFREPYDAKLYRAVKGAIVEVPFTYALVKRREYAIENNIGIEYIKPTQTIKTGDLELPFANGQKIKLEDGRVMTVSTAYKEYDEKRAMFTDGATHWVIVLEGGGE